MTIQPTTPGSTPTTGTDRLDRKAPLSPARPSDTSTSEVTSATPDKVQISDAARGLLQNRLELVSQLPPGRLREVLERLNNGFYDRPEVRRAVVESIAEELNPPKVPSKR
jgi:hypothetical protein